MNNQMRNAIQRAIIVSVVMSYNGKHDEIEKLNEFELNENYFDGYFKAMVKAINKLREKNPIVNDIMLEDFLEQHNFFKGKEFCEMLATNQLIYDLVVWYYDKLKDDYIKRMAL